MIVDKFRKICKKVEDDVLSQLKEYDENIKVINYEHGHYAEIHATLVEFERSKKHYNKKYPLIALLEDIQENVRENGLKEAVFTIVICYSTKSDIKSAERYKDVIKPVLEIIYNSLIENIKKSGFFAGYNVNHTKIIRPYYGTPTKDGNTANIFSDILDAIELRNIRLIQYNNDC